MSQIFASERQDVSVGAHNHREVAQERRDAAQSGVGVLDAVLIPVIALGALNARVGKELFQSCSYTHRSATGSATAVRSGERFVQIDVHNVEAQVARAALAQHGVEVGAVVVHESAAVVHQLGNLCYVVFKDTQCVRVRHHHAGNVVAQQWLEVIHIHCAIRPALHHHHFQSANGRTGGVGAVSRVGDDDLGALAVVAAHVVGTHNHEPCEFTVCSGIGIEREFAQSGDFGERPLQVVIDFQRALHCVLLL